MADLILSDEQKQYQALARDFSKSELAPRAHEFDRSGTFPEEVCRKAWEIGLFNILVPEKLGGLGLNVWDACVMAEEISAACIGIGAAILGHNLAVSYLLAAGTEQQQKSLLEPLTTEFGFGAFCFDDTAGTYGVKYKRSGNSFTLDGRLPSINVGHASWLVVQAHDADDSRSSSIFIVQANTPGLFCGNTLPRVGMRAADLRVTEFDKVKVQIENLLGTTGSGAMLARGARAFIDPVIAANAIGVMRSALDNSIRYSKERFTMGQPIGNHQAVAFMLAELAKDAEAARLMAWKSAWLCDNGNPKPQNSASARTFACDAAMRGTTDAVQVYGGYGYSREYPVEKLMRDAKALQIVMGGGNARKHQIGQRLLAGVTAGA